MALAQQFVFVLAALAPFVVADLSLSRSSFGSVITVSYVATVGLSLLTGRLVDVVGARRALAVLLLVVSASLLIASFASTFRLLLLAAGVAGIAQALSLPSTNRLVVAHVPVARQSAAVGVKQSGVQLGALVAGLALPALAADLGWRGAIRLLAVAPLVLLAFMLATVPADPPVEHRSLLQLPAAPSRRAVGLMVYSLCLGSGTAAVNTFLPLYAHERLHLSEGAAGAVLAALGVSGVLARIVWTVLSGRLRDPSVALLMLGVAAAGFTLVVWQAERLGVVALWLGALGLGASAVAANAVSTLIVVRESGLGRIGQVSALIGLSFFSGFVLSPVAFGLLTDVAGGYAVGWFLVCVLFTASAAVAGGLHRVRARGEPTTIAL